MAAGRRVRVALVLALTGCGSSKRDAGGEGPPAAASDSAEPLTSSPSIPTRDTAAASTGDTWPWQTVFPTGDTGPPSQRDSCDPGSDPRLAPPAVVSTDPLTGCLAGRTRTELVKPLTLASMAPPEVGPGSAACVYDQLTVPLSSELTATVPTAVELVTWDLAQGERLATHELTLDGPDDDVVAVSSPGLCEPQVAASLHTRCQGTPMQGRGVASTGQATWTTGAGLFEVSVPWADDVDETWVWVLVDRYQLALGPWPATRVGDDWVGGTSWLEAGLATDGDEVQVGVLGCLGGEPVRSRIVP